MNTVTRRSFLSGACVAAASLAACGSQGDESSAGSSAGGAGGASASGLALDSAKWQYNADDDVYYQLGISYCTNPADSGYEQLALFVPGAYFEAKDNGDGTFTCMPSDAKQVGGFTATTAPIVIPVNTPGYSAQSPLGAYTSLTAYTGKGLVYAHAGCRGRDAGAPAGVVDLKAAVRFLRAVSASMAGNVDCIFTFGMSGGGAQSAIMGATGDSPLYEPYLKAIGAAEQSDAILGSMDWCPITGLDVADGAYEWMMGVTREGLSEEEQTISDELAKAFAAYVNEAGIVDEGGAQLTLDESDEGVFQAGSYYNRVVQAIETSLNDFLQDTEFPYDASSANAGGGPGGGMGGGRPDGAPDGTPPDGGPGGTPPDGGPGATGADAAATSDASSAADSAGVAPAAGALLPNTGEEGTTTGGAQRGSGGPTEAVEVSEQVGVVTEENSAEADAVVEEVAARSTDDASQGGNEFEQRDNISRTQTSGGVSISGTYETVDDYIAALNADEEWVTYDEATNTATITSVAAFCKALKVASKSLGAFDQLDRGQGENTLFGIDGTAAHFDATLAGILEKAGSSYASDFASDLKTVDGQGNDVQTRVNMYTPLYYLLGTAEGHGTSTPAKHWRIRSGINQGDTALTTELNLALALEADSRVESVDFAAVWGQGHTMAERTGSSDDNFIAWVETCLG